MKNKIISIILAIISILTLSMFVGCGEPDSNDTTPSEVNYVRVDEEGFDDENGEYIQFGLYPQTDVTLSLGEDLNDIAGNLPTVANKNGWTSYGFYKNKVKEDFAWYKDVNYNGEKYRGVYFTEFRRSDAISFSDDIYPYQQTNGYETNTVYWFSYDAITWKILQINGKTALLFSNQVIDTDVYTASSENTSPSNYKNSDLRNWLNDKFLNMAFTTEQKSIIKTTLVDNSAETTESSENTHVCENTQDKIFALSYQEMLKTEYGFEQLPGDYPSRKKTATSYAKALGVYCDSEDYANYWQRTPALTYNYHANHTTLKGNAKSACLVTLTSIGMAPALNITL